MDCIEMTLNLDTIGGRLEETCPENVGLLTLQSNAKDIIMIDGECISFSRYALAVVPIL